MSSSRDFSDGRRAGKGSEKSNFVNTCNLLSQYIKEKGSLRDLNLEIDGKVENLEAIVKPGSSSACILNNKGKSAQLSREKQASMAAPPLPTIHIDEDSSYKSISKEPTTTATKAAQLTIFYAGKVLVFDNYPADKAKELMAFAKKGSSQMSYGIWVDTFREKTSATSGGGGAVASTSGPPEGLPPRPQTSSSHKGVGISSNTCKEKTSNYVVGGETVAINSRKQVSQHPEASGSDLPIARRSSLHRFLEKRKDRAAGRGPYQVQEQPASSSRGDEQLDLKL